jgi:hypothetical protein
MQLYSMYLNAYVARHGLGKAQIDDALHGPVDSAAIADLVRVARGCISSLKNPCIDKTFHDIPPSEDGQMEAVFARGGSSTDVGYSERSFYEEIGQTSVPDVVPMPYGPNPVMLMYVDALVRSKARCAGQPCAGDADDFTRFLNSNDTRAYIAFSGDLGSAGKYPPRHLLSATRGFYDLPEVKQDPIYATIMPLLGAAVPMPTNIDAATLKGVDDKVCKALVVPLPTYNCGQPTSKGTSQ